MENFDERNDRVEKKVEWMEGQKIHEFESYGFITKIFFAKSLPLSSNFDIENMKDLMELLMNGVIRLLVFSTPMFFGDFSFFNEVLHFSAQHSKYFLMIFRPWETNFIQKFIFNSWGGFQNCVWSKTRRGDETGPKNV